jgi:hypothetical protein
MSLNIQLTPILKYLHQIRKIQDYVVFDMYFPNSWKILKKFIIEDKFVNMGTVDEGLIGMSFVSEINEDNLNLTQNNIIGIINFNLDVFYEMR